MQFASSYHLRMMPKSDVDFGSMAESGLSFHILQFIKANIGVANFKPISRAGFKDNSRRPD